MTGNQLDGADVTPYTSGTFRQRLQRWCKKAGVPVMPPCALRHVFGTRQASNGTNQAILAQLMGHSNLQTTARYVVNCDAAHLKAMDEMSRRMMPLVERAKHDLSLVKVERLASLGTCYQRGLARA